VRVVPDWVLETLCEVAKLAQDVQRTGEASEFVLDELDSSKDEVSAALEWVEDHD